MRKVNLSWLLPILFVLGGVIIFFGTFSKAESATAGHVVISEVLSRGLIHANDEFIELYNPTLSDVNLSGWFLTKKTQAGLFETTIASIAAGIIPSHGFFLIANSQSSASNSADFIYSSPIGDNNTISLYKDNKTNLIDKVGIGAAIDAEGSSTATPSAGQSVERKANSSSDITSMTTGGDKFAGNGEDTGNNFNDFVLREIPQPQNSHSDIEPVPTPTPTETPTPTPTPTLVPTSTPTPTVTPFPTLSPTPTATITPTPTGSPTFPRFTVVCSTKILSLNFGFIHIRVPFFTCKLIKI